MGKAYTRDDKRILPEICVPRFIVYQSATNCLGITNEDPLPCDSVLFHAMEMESCRRHLEYLARVLTSRQTLGKYVVNYLRNDRSGFACILSFFNYLGGMDNSPLVNSLAYWRVFCVYRGSGNILR